MGREEPLWIASMEEFALGSKVKICILKQSVRKSLQKVISISHGKDRASESL